METYSQPQTRQTPPAKPKLLDPVRQATRTLHYSFRTEKAYVSWIRRFIFFNDKRHPDDVGEEEVTAFLNYLAVELNVSASTQNQARNAILFLYKNVLRRELDWLEGIVQAKGPLRLPVVLSRSEVAQLLRRLDGTPWLMASLIYGSGLRLLECYRLRVKERHELTVRNGKGQKDRGTVFPVKLEKPLTAHLERMKEQHERDLKMGAGNVELPFAFSRKSPSAAKQWAWQWDFSARGPKLLPRESA